LLPDPHSLEVWPGVEFVITEIGADEFGASAVVAQGSGDADLRALLAGLAAGRPACFASMSVPRGEAVVRLELWGRSSRLPFDKGWLATDARWLLKHREPLLRTCGIEPLWSSGQLADPPPESQHWRPLADAFERVPAELLSHSPHNPGQRLTLVAEDILVVVSTVRVAGSPAHLGVLVEAAVAFDVPASDDTWSAVADLTQSTTPDISAYAFAEPGLPQMVDVFVGKLFPWETDTDATVVLESVEMFASSARSHTAGFITMAGGGVPYKMTFCLPDRVCLDIEGTMFDIEPIRAHRNGTLAPQGLHSWGYENNASHPAAVYNYLAHVALMNWERDLAAGIPASEWTGAAINMVLFSERAGGVVPENLLERGKRASTLAEQLAASATAPAPSKHTRGLFRRR
jgi:hypothetical protein